MWSRSVKLDAAQAQAWWQERAAALEYAGPEQVLDFVPVTLAQVGSMFGVDEHVATGVYASMHRCGVLTGLLFMSGSDPAAQLLTEAAGVFNRFAALEGCEVERPYAIVDMRTTLAESLAAQTLSLDLVAMAAMRNNARTFAFVPNWRVWSVASNLEYHVEAA